MAKNLNSPNGLVVIFTIAKLMKILKPYIEEKQLSHFEKNLFNSFYSSTSIEDKPKANMMAAVTTFFKKKICQEDSLTDIQILKDRSVLDPMAKGETIAQDSSMDSLLVAYHSIKQTDKKKILGDATIQHP
jgi:hypothetical protein